MTGQVITVAFSPLTEGQVRACTPVSVYFYLSSDFDSAPRQVDLADPGWRVRVSDNDPRNTNDFLNTMLDLTIGGKRLPDFLSHARISYWQFLPSFIWPAFLLVIEIIRAVRPIVEEFKPRAIRVIPVTGRENSIWTGAIRAVGQAYKAQVIVLPRKSSVVLSFKQFFRSSGLNFLLYRWANMIVARVLSIFVRHTSRVGSRKKLVFLTFERHWVADPEGRGKKYDDQFSSIITAFRPQGWSSFTGIDCPYASLPLVIRKLWSRLKQSEQGVVWKSFYAYTSFFLQEIEVIKARKFFSGKFSQLSAAEDFIHDFRYQGIGLMPALESDFRFALSVLLPECVHMVGTAGRMLQIEAPNAALVTYETGPFQRAVITKADELGIPTIGLQHGAILPSNYDYMHKQITNSLRSNPASFSVPTVTCVWSDRWRRNLIEKGSYKQEYLAITGSWRQDKILRLLQNIDPGRIKKSLGIGEGKRVVLVLTGAQNVIEYVRCCADYFKDDPKTIVLIKPHAADDLIIRKASKNLCPPNAKIIQDYFYEALSISDLVISQPSTAIAESVQLGKPVIMVNFFKLRGFEEYIESGACLYADSPEKLKVLIRETVHDRAALENSKAAGERFVREWFFKPDGNSAQRVVSVVEALIRDKKNA